MLRRIEGELNNPNNSILFNNIIYNKIGIHRVYMMAEYNGSNDIHHNNFIDNTQYNAYNEYAGIYTTLSPSVTTDVYDNVHIVWEEHSNFGASICYKMWDSQTQSWIPSIEDSSLIIGNGSNPSMNVQLEPQLTCVLSQLVKARLALTKVWLAGRLHVSHASNDELNVDPSMWQLRVVILQARFGRVHGEIGMQLGSPPTTSSHLQSTGSPQPPLSTAHSSTSTQFGAPPTTSRHVM